MAATKADVLENLRDLPNPGQDAEALLAKVLPGVSNGDLTLQEVVEGLGSSLTHTNVADRAVGTRFLADILHSLPQNKLNADELTFLTAFFVDRLKDHHSVVPNVIYAVLALVQQENIQRGDIVNLIRGFFREVHCQSQVMSDRRNVYTFLKYCIINKLECVKEMGTDFVLGFITAMDGEKDPRNLVLLFALIPTIVSHLPLGPFTEDMFEVVAAYFPIDFVPPADDPYGISSEDLVLGLRQALSSTHHFAPFCIPLLQEKLDSDLSLAKLDSLHTLVACCEAYTSEDIRPHIPTLWASIRREVIEANSAEGESAALSALTAIILTLNRGMVTHAGRDAMNMLIKSAMIECLGHLTAPEQRLMFPSAYLLLAVVVAGQGPAEAICGKVFPLLVEQFDNKTEDTARKNTITILAKFLEQGAKYPSLKEDGGSLAEHEASCWRVFLQGLTNNQLAVQEASVSALTTALPAFQTKYLMEGAHTLTSILISANSSSLRDQIIKCFVAMGKLHPPAISENTLPQLLAEMEKGSTSISPVSESQVLETLAILTTGKFLLSRVLDVVWHHVENTLKSSTERCCLYLSCVLKIIKNTISSTECLNYILEDWSGLLKVISLCVKAIVSQEIQNPVPALQHLSSVCRVIVAKMGDPRPVVQSLIDLLIVGELNSLEGLVKELVSQHPEVTNLLSNMADAENPRAALMVFIYEGVLLGLRKGEHLENMEQLLGKLRHLSVYSDNPTVRETSAVLHAAVINKVSIGPKFTQAINSASDELNQVLDSASSLDKQQAALYTWTWTSKALVLRGASEEALWTAKMQGLLSDPTVGLQAAHGFGIILKDHDYALRPETYANIRLLYKQRYFEHVIGPLVDLFNSAENSTKQKALLAISSLLPSLPQLVLNAHIKRLLPVLLQGITCDEETVTESTLTSLVSLLQQSVEHACPHVSTLIPTLLLLATDHPLKVRMKSLECLQVLTSLPTPTIVPYREDVNRGLRPVLNDKKRVIRKVAATTRSSWILVGAPGGS
ncbi:MMS19 nucleotide excision repair protein homolog [Penaeus indicus]|uniref:MMS19 nucleotide excision repair protein homolog n=1 Tax=Penaeus indicus TaxID=29960 RepID=UPI00300D2C25